MARGGAANRGRGGGARMANIEDVYERDDAGHDAIAEERFQLMEQRLEQRLEQRIDQRFDQLREDMLAQFAALQYGRRPHHQSRSHTPEEEEVFDDEPTNLFGAHPPRERREREFIPNTCDSRWEAGLKIDIPEFHGGLSVEDFLDWVNAVEDILEFEEVPEGKQVPLVATRFRGSAAAWWQFTKVTRNRQGKQKISSWKKLKSHMRDTFLPYNYSHQMYQRRESRVIPNNRDFRWKSGLKIEATKFKGSLQPDDFLNCDSPPLFDDYPDDGVVFNDGCLSTSTTTSNLVVDLSKLPSFDEEPSIEEEICIEEETKTKNREELHFQKEMLQVDFFENFQEKYHYEDPFDFVGAKFSTSWFIKKLIMEYFILTQWTDWMSVVTKVGKFKVCLPNLNSRTSFFNTGRMMQIGSIHIRSSINLGSRIENMILIKTHGTLGVLEDPNLMGNGPTSNTHSYAVTHAGFRANSAV